MPLEKNKPNKQQQSSSLENSNITSITRCQTVASPTSTSASSIQHTTMSSPFSIGSKAACIPSPMAVTGGGGGVQNILTAGGACVSCQLISQQQTTTPLAQQQQQQCHHHHHHHHYNTQKQRKQGMPLTPGAAGNKNFALNNMTNLPNRYLDAQSC